MPAWRNGQVSLLTGFATSAAGIVDALASGALTVLRSHMGGKFLAERAVILLGVTST